MLMSAPATVEAQFRYTTNDGAIMLARYTGSAGAVVISNFVTSIASSAFFGLTNLASVTIPGSVTSIGDYAFNGCSGLTNASITNGVSSIGAGAFMSTGLTGFTIPASVTNIHFFNTNDGHSGAFAACAQMTAFTVDALNPVYSSLNGVLFDSSQATLLQFPCGLGGSYAIPGTVTAIWAEAFQWCSGLTNITIPASVTNIGDFAFYECTSLASVYFGGNAPAADSGVYDNDHNMTNYYLPGTAGWSNSFAGRLALPYINPSQFIYTTNADNTLTITGCTDSCGAVFVPSTMFGLPVTSIGPNAFYDCTNLTSVAIPSTVTNIAGDAFSGCANLSGVYFRGRCSNRRFVGVPFGL